MAVLNGRIPAALLGKIPGSGVLFPLVFIPQVAALRAAFEVRFSKPLVITDGYRPYSGSYYAQVETMLRRYRPYDEYVRLTGRAPVGRKSHLWEGERRYLLPGEAQVAYPGTSRHGNADAPALDLGSRVNVMDSAEHRWVVANAPRFGFRWPEEWARVGGEPWHIEATRVAHVGNDVINVNPIDHPILPDLPTPLDREDDDMPTIIESDGGLWLDTGAGEVVGLTDPATATAYEGQGVKRVKIPRDDLRQLRAARAGRELITDGNSYAVGVPGLRYRPLTDLEEVRFHQAAGCRDRRVTTDTYANLTGA